MEGLSQSLESVLGAQRPGAQAPSGPFRVDQHGRLVAPELMALRNAALQKDPRRFSEASINPPPRPPPPNLKRLNIKPFRRPPGQPPGQLAPGAPRPGQPILPPAPPQLRYPPHHGNGGSNLARMAQLARSTPQLDEYADARERVREREKAGAQNARESLTAQVMEAVHGVTIEEVHAALQRSDWNPVRAEQQLKLEQLYLLSLCSRDDCVKMLSRYQWNLQLASSHLIRWAQEDRAAPGDRLSVSSERRV